jgi:tol-pal system protein YbgF
LVIEQPQFAFIENAINNFRTLNMLKHKLFAVALLMSVAIIPAHADDVTNRMDALEQQVRNLVGQIEELNYTIKQMQGQSAGVPQLQQGAAEPVAPKPLVLKKKLVLNDTKTAGVETIQETPMQQDAAQGGSLYDGGAEQTAEKPLGTLGTAAAKAGDGGFDGQVLVAPEGDQATVAAPGDGVEQVSVQPETPDDLFLRSEKSLLQLQYAEAETGFKEFLSKYPEHNLAGSAQYKLGETFYAQQNYSEAAQNYLTGYKQYPKSRRAADSLMKLGLSLNKLGQKDQGCAALGSVGSEFPNSVEAKKRAQAEFKRASC